MGRSTGGGSRITLLFKVGPTDPLVVASVCAVLTAAAMLASHATAHRATRFDPIQALRVE